jgi:hypothetical protein
MPRSIITLVFRCRGELTPNAEATAFRWATAAEIPTLASEAFAIRLLDALNAAAPPAVRYHDGTHLI